MSTSRAFAALTSLLAGACALLHGVWAIMRTIIDAPSVDVAVFKLNEFALTIVH
jgi:hypothetical protein